MHSAVVNLDFSTLQHLDNGKLAAAFNAHLRRVVADMMDRPGDERERTITMKWSFSPVMDDQRFLESTGVHCNITSNIPDMRTRRLSLGARPNGQLYFAVDSPDSHDQTSLLAPPSEPPAAG